MGRYRSAMSRFVARLPIRWRLTLMSFGLLAVLLAALGTLLSISEEHTLLANQAIALNREARLVGGILREPGLALARDGHALPAAKGTLPVEAFTALTFVVQRLSNAGTSVAVLQTDGTMLVSSANLYDVYDTGSTAPAVMTLSPAVVRQALSGPPTTDAYVIGQDSAGASQLVVLIPIVDSVDQTTVGILQVSTPTEPIDAAVTSTRIALALGVAGALCIAAALTLPLMSAGLRPLVTMERVSRKIAAGELSLRLDVPPVDDEIGRLARSFNSMVQQLEAAFTRQRRFVADVSHELRTPLTALSGELEMLLLGADRGDPEAMRRLTRGMYVEVDRMRRLVEDLLTLTRLDEGQVGLRIEPVALAPVIEDVAAQAERIARGQSIALSLAPELPPVRADADRVRQVLLNLVENAVKYTPADGTITLRAAPEGDGMIAVEVVDTGEGIPAESLPHVFERFYRVDPARSRSGRRAGGAGLGLSIARSLIEAQGGRISIQSTEGEGTTVSIHLRVADAASPERVRPAPPPAVASAGAVE
jgi:two-component system OmpR family sensor kinase